MPKKVIKRDSLLLSHPALSQEWDSKANGLLQPDMITAGSSKKVWWLKVCDEEHPRGTHSWKASVAHRVSGTGCPICSNRTVWDGYNDLKTTHPDIATEWHPTKNGSLTADQVISGTPRKVWWLGACEHDWDANVSSRTLLKTGCPYCSNQKILAGFNDLATKRPDLAAMWSPKNIHLATEVGEKSHKKALWVGECGHEFEATISDITRGRRCSYCAGKKVLLGFNDLLSQHPDIAAEWHPTKNNKKPTDYTPGAEVKVWWKCSNNHDYPAWINVKVSQKTGCPFCKNKKLLLGYNDLATTNPELAKEWSIKNKNSPEDTIGANNKKVLWECMLEHEWEQTISVRKRGYGCPTCYSKTSKAEFLLREALSKVLLSINKDHTFRILLPNGKTKKQVDIIGESLAGHPVIVEYDGWYWHKDKVDKDTNNSLLLLSLGYKIIRIRERSGKKVLSPIIIDNRDFFSLSADFIQNEEQAAIIAEKIKDWLDTSNNGVES